MNKRIWPPSILLTGHKTIAELQLESQIKRLYEPTERDKEIIQDFARFGVCPNDLPLCLYYWVRKGLLEA